MVRNLIYATDGEASTINAVAALDVTNVVLGQMHFYSQDTNHDGKTYPAGTLCWNDTPMSEVDSSVWAAVSSLAGSGGDEKVISIQLGSGGNGTWGWIAANMDQAATNLMAFFQDYGQYKVSGIDLDPEPPGTVSLRTLLDFTEKLGEKKAGSFQYLSHCPVPWDSNYYPQIYDTQNWSNIGQYVDWIMVQWYGGFEASTYESFVSSYGPSADQLVAGMKAPGDLATMVKEIIKLHGDYSDAWGGVGTWDYSATVGTNWNACIDSALQGTVGSGCS